MSHVHHDSLSGYDPGNVLHDGCPECESRAEDPLHALLLLDDFHRLQLWRDMRTLMLMFSPEECVSPSVGRELSRCDTRLLNALYDVAVLLERTGISPDEMETRLARKLNAEDVRTRLRAAP